MKFEWDDNKNRQNLQKHGISFEEAQEIFNSIVFTSIDERYDYYDYNEIREISIGAIEGLVIIIVAHTTRDNKIRLISARKATPKERKTYYAYLAQSS
jgi:uncharacterized DUF497 family protein